MTFFSLAQARRCLGIDAKTLHRWLAEAQLPLQNHPQDGRKKGLCLEHLELLARLHQRSLVSSPEPALLPVPASQPEVSALTETLQALHAQILALQQQVAELSNLLQQRTPLPAPPVSSVKHLAKPPSRSTTSALPKKPARHVHVIPRVEYSSEGRYVIICPKRGILPFEPDTPEWFAWIAKQDSFRFVGKRGHFTAHHWWRVPSGAWRAHRQIRNHSYNVRLAPNQHLTIAVLEQAAEVLQAHLA
jgi:hypothetical protein